MKRPIIIFYLLLFYVLLQSLWWGIHIIDLNEEIYTLKKESVQAHNIAAKKDEASGINLYEKLMKRKLMVVGEGGVFLLLLLIGAYITWKSFRKEIAMSQQQKNFLMSVTHELKSPIASMKLGIETMMTRTLDNEKTITLLGNVLDDANRLSRLVDNFLLSKGIESGSFLLNKTAVNMSELVKSLIGKLREDVLKEFTVNDEIKSGVFVFGDSEALHSVVRNLIDNAVNYSPAGSQIDINLFKNEHGVTLSIADQGKGIPDKEKENIFKKFYRIEKEETRQTKGTGLGLFIVKYIVEQHGGSVRVEANSPSGSVFTVIFPK